MIHTGDCIEVMARMPADSVDAVVTDPPYGLEFMGKGWDKFDTNGRDAFRHKRRMETALATKKGDPWASERKSYGSVNKNPRCKKCSRLRWDHGPRRCQCESPDWDMRIAESMRPFQEWCEAWGREALRVTKPGGYLLAFGGTRTHHRLVCGLEDAGWIIRDELDWIYASGFPKGKANLKPAHEPIVLARKPGPLRPLAIDECRIGTEVETWPKSRAVPANNNHMGYGEEAPTKTAATGLAPQGRWPSNLLLSSPELFDEPNPYVVGSGATLKDGVAVKRNAHGQSGGYGGWAGDVEAPDAGYGGAGGYSRFFRIPGGAEGSPASMSSSDVSLEPPGGHYPSHFIQPKADRSDREPIVRGQLAERSAGVTGRRSVEPGEYDEPVHPAPVGLGAWLKAQRIAAGYTRQTLAPLLSGHKNLESAAANVSNWEHEFNRPTPDQWRTLRSVLGFDDRYDEVMTTTRKVDRELFDDRPPPQRENAHPTVKPTDLMRHLVRLVTPSGGTVLDPFLGSGSTAIACELEGFPWIGIEKDASYVAIAEARLNGTQRGLGLDVPAPTKRRSVPSDDKLAELGKTYPRRGWMPDFKTDKPEEAA